MSLDRAVGMSPFILPLLGFPGVVKAPGEGRSTMATDSLCHRILPALWSGIPLCGPRRESAENKEQQRARRVRRGGHSEKFGFFAKVTGVIGGFSQGWMGKRKKASTM